jgi:CRISPR-associated protein Csx16
LICLIIDAGGSRATRCKLAIASLLRRTRHNDVMINDSSTAATSTRMGDQAAKSPKPRHFFVSRHRGAIDWARRHPWAIRADFLPHLDLARVAHGDIVIGTLPVHLVAAVCARGAKYLHLTINLMAQQRGQELTADELDAAGAHLVPYWVQVEHF